MSIWVIVGLAVLILAGIFVLRGNKSKQDAPDRATPPRVNTRGPGKAPPPRPVVKKPGDNKPKFAGEVFAQGEDACIAAEAMNRKTFEKDHGTSIPLPQCDKPNDCLCTMREVEERRHGDRRKAIDRRTDVRFADDRRSGRDRRKGADAWKGGV